MGTMKIAITAVFFAFLASCEPDAPPPPPPAPLVRLPPEIQASIVALTQDEADMETKRGALQQEIRGLEAKKLELDAATGKARYMIRLELSQSHFSLSIKEHLKDHFNKVDFWLPVDREMYESAAVGSELVDKFRVGSMIFAGSYGSWDVKVIEKKLVEK